MSKILIPQAFVEPSERISNPVQMPMLLLDVAGEDVQLNAQFIGAPTTLKMVFEPPAPMMLT